MVLLIPGLRILTAFRCGGFGTKKSSRVTPQEDTFTINDI